jgi:hypothetical protein
MKKNEYRRRQDPVYDVFSRRVPEKLGSLEFSMVKGVMVVFDVLCEGMARPIPGQLPASERFSAPSFSEFVVDFDYVSRLCITYAVSFAYHDCIPSLHLTLTNYHLAAPHDIFRSREIVLLQASEAARVQVQATLFAQRRSRARGNQVCAAQRLLQCS